jgi:hypothetical protein
MVCCICLEPALKRNPLYLIGCGCKLAWFHKECQDNWVTYSQANIPLICPTCRQAVPLTYNYSFSYDTGIPQKALCLTSIVFFIESMMNLYYTQYTMIVQSSTMLCFPFIFSSTRNWEYFLLSYRMIFLSEYLYLIVMPTYKYKLDNIIYYRYLFILYLFFQYFTEIRKSRAHVLEPYVISADIYNKEVMLAKPVSGALKRTRRRFR